MQTVRWSLIASALLAVAGCGSKVSADQGQTVAAAAVDGRAAFNVCANCHSIDGSRTPAPPLLGVFGRRAGSLPGVTYSPAMQASGITWDAAELDAYLAGPGQSVPGTSMSYTVSDPATRAALIDYLSRH
jgi:cytochrome c